MIQLKDQKNIKREIHFKKIFYFHYIINIDRSIDDMIACFEKVKMVFGVSYGYSRDV